MSEPDWKQIALYLADCHAATAEYEGAMNSVSRRRKDRYASICRTSHRLISGIEPTKRNLEPQQVLDRLCSGAEIAGGQGDE